MWKHKDRDIIGIETRLFAIFLTQSPVSDAKE